MGNLFTRQIRKRAQADEEMRRKADGLINEAITRKKTRDIFEEVNSNEEALDAILFICGIEEDRLDNLENEDILFTRVETDPDWYRCQTGCCIGIDTEGKYVALVPGLFLDYYYYDADGKKQRVNKKNAGRFTRVYCLCRLLPDLTLSIPDLLRYLLSFLRRKNLISFIVITLAAGILGLVFPRTVTALMNTADPSAAGGTLRTDFITKVAVLCLLAELLRLLLNMLLAVFGSGFTNMVCYNIKNAALIRYLSDSGENSQQDTTEVWNAINRSVPEFTESLLSSGINMIPHLVFVVFYCLAAAYYLGKTSLWMFLVLAVLALSLWIVNTRFDHWYSLTVKNYFRGAGILFQIFRGIEKIRSREAQKRVYLKWAQIYSEEAFSDRYRKKWQSAGLGVQDFVGPAMTVVLILAVTRRDTLLQQETVRRAQTGSLDFRAAETLPLAPVREYGDIAVLLAQKEGRVLIPADKAGRHLLRERRRAEGPETAVRPAQRQRRRRHETQQKRCLEFHQHDLSPSSLYWHFLPMRGKYSRKKDSCGKRFPGPSGDAPSRAAVHVDAFSKSRKVYSLSSSIIWSRMSAKSGSNCEPFPISICSRTAF